MSNPNVFQFEYIDAPELAKRLGLPTTWIYEQSRSRQTTDRIPAVRFGRYVRFPWGSAELAQWLERRMSKPR